MLLWTRFAFCENLSRKSNQDKRGRRVNWWSVEPFDAVSQTRAMLSSCYFAHNSWLTAWKLPAWMPLSCSVFSHRCAEAKFPRCLLQLEWKQIQFFPWGLANSILCPSSLSPSPPPPSPLPLPIQLQYLAPVNSFTLTNNAQEDTLLAIIRPHSEQLYMRGPRTSAGEIYCFIVDLYDHQVHNSAAKYGCYHSFYVLVQHIHCF